MKKLALIFIAMMFLEGCSSVSDRIVSEASGALAERALANNR